MDYKDNAVSEANKYVDQLDETLSKFDSLNQLEAKTGVRRAYLVLGAGLFLVSFILFGFGSSPLCNLVGFVYPIYQSYKALKTATKEDDSQWLTYWIVYGFLTLVESFTDFFLFWIPFYYFVKIAFLVWCFLPQFKGATWLYQNAIGPLLNRYEKAIDRDIAEVESTFRKKDS